MPDESNILRTQSAEEYDPTSADLAQKIGKAARSAFQVVFPEWHKSSRPRTQSEAAEFTVEAQIAAASLGRKPLYFDPWGPYAELLTLKLQGKLLPGTEVRAWNGYLYIYRPEKIRPILDADPAFYRPNGEDDFSAITRVSERFENGDLLGYGARAAHLPGTVEVAVTLEGRLLFVIFSSDPEAALRYGTDRARDISDYLEAKVEFSIREP